MIDQHGDGSWWLASRARGVGLVLRLLILVSPLVAVMCTRLAAGHTVAVVVIIIVGLTLVCVVVPDSHAGLLVVLLIGIQWLATVRETSSPWSLGVAVSLTAFHASMAAAIVAPPSARWTRAMCRRWMRRSLAVMMASSATWAATRSIDGLAIGGNEVLITASLIALAAAGLWAREGRLDAGRPG